MRQHRIYHPNDLSPAKIDELNDKAAHHVAKVLRLKTGEVLTLFDGQGRECLASIKSVSKNKVTVVMDEVIDCQRESPLGIHLAQGLSKGERMDVVVQKATELGVKSFTPLISERSVVKLDEKRMQKKLMHWQGIVISASEQCGRNQLMTIHPPLKLSQWLQSEIGHHSLILSPSAKTSFHDISINNTSVSLMIGPEGGFSESEIEEALSAKAQALSLGPRILRTETAAIAVCAILQSRFGDLS